MLNTIIIDDEPASIQYLSNICENITEISLVGTFINPMEALDFLVESFKSSCIVNLVFLDIEMPQCTGIELAHSIREISDEIALVFVTGYDDFALDAFKLDAISYLLKPCDIDDVKKAVDKTRKLFVRKDLPVIKTFGGFFLSWNGSPIHFSNNKAKEFLALLIDRRGSEVSIGQAVDILWENRPYDDTVKQLYRKAVIYLNQLCKQYNWDFFISSRGSCHIVPEKMTCDYFDVLDKRGASDYAHLFLENYLPEYDWAEETNAILFKILSALP